MPSPPRHLLLLRHGQSTWNAESRWQGQADPPLSARGEEEARAAVGQLAEVPFVRVLSSDLRRALDTARTLAAALHLPVEVDARLREIDVGDWQGLTRPEIEARWPGELARWSAGISESPPGGESRAALVARTRVVLSEVAASSRPGDQVLLVAHGALIRHLDRALGLELRTVPNLGGRWYDVDDEGAIVPGDLLLPAVTASSPAARGGPWPPPSEAP